MFTGLIQGTGLVKSITPAGGGKKITVEWSGFAGKLTPGASVAIDGVCLSAEEIAGDTATFTAVEETVRRTTLKYLKVGDRVNIELPLTPQSFLDGHIVLGHIDCVGRISSFKPVGAQYILEIEYPPEYQKLLVEKGSIAIDGISLTVVDVSNKKFRCAIIPETMKRTTLGQKSAGDYVNLEFDIIAKYIWKQSGSPDRDDEEILPSYF
ncbi:riboflavin synthase [bacterium]|nr:riboflavin synthase [bacterium]